MCTIHQRRSGLTLVELLVVIAIIALGAMLLPALRKAVGLDETELAIDAFIVTRSRENIRLGLLEIRCAKLDDVVAAARYTVRRLKQEEDSLAIQLEAKEKELQELQAELRQSKQVEEDFKAKDRELGDLTREVQRLEFDRDSKERDLNKAIHEAIIAAPEPIIHVDERYRDIPTPSQRSADLPSSDVDVAAGEDVWLTSAGKRIVGTPLRSTYNSDAKATDYEFAAPDGSNLSVAQSQFSDPTREALGVAISRRALRVKNHIATERSLGKQQVSRPDDQLQDEKKPSDAKSVRDKRPDYDEVKRKLLESPPEEIQRLQKVLGESIVRLVAAREAASRSTVVLTELRERHENLRRRRGLLPPLEEEVRKLLVSRNDAAASFVRATLAKFPAPAMVAKTDADGKAVVRVSRDAPFLIWASCDRAVLDQVEQYNWLVKVPSEGSTKQTLFLSSDNLATQGSILSLFGVGQ